MKNVVIVGCGNIGSRLLQSVSNCTNAGPLNIIALEPFKAAWETARARFEEANQGKHSFSLISAADELPKNADLMVFAMDARNRLAAMKSCFAKCSTNNVLLEKILFTKAGEYEEAQALVQGMGAKCWVNTSRNVWPGYQQLRKILANEIITRFDVKGSDWALGCNSIHFLSAFEFIAGEAISSLRLNKDTASIYQSKRAGYKDLTGELLGTSPSGASISVASLAEPDIAIQVTVTTENNVYEITEGKQVMSIDGGDPDHPFGLLYTSQLNGMFERILKDGKCDLPNLEQSTALHLQLISALNEIFHGDASLAYECPIT